MSLKDKIIEGTALLGATNILMRFFSFFTILMVVRGLTVYQYGIFTLFMSLAGIIGVFSSMGMDSLILSDASSNLGAKNLIRAKSILWHFFRLRLITLLLIAVLLYIFKGWLEMKYGSIVTQYFWILILMALAQYLKNVYSLLFQIHEHFRLLALIDILETVIKFIFITILYFLGKLNIISLIFVYIAGMIISAIIITPQLKRMLKYLANVPVEKIKLVYQIFKEHGKWQIGANLLSSSTGTVKYWLVRLIISTEAVGFLALAQNLYSVLISLVPLQTVILPIISKKIQDRFLLKHMLERITKYSLVVYGFMILGALFVISPLIPYVFPKYVVAIPIFQLLVFKLLFNAFSMSQTTILLAFRQQKIFFVCGLATLFSIIILSPLLMLKFGLIGTVIEAFITIFAVVVIREVYLRKKYALQTIGFKSFFTIDSYDRMIIGEAAMKIKKIFLWKKQS
ncbi:oligosaccharide flippase family protein [Patescibacteria group bacterium]|nr:oligosaccharide flippase family protein [Patescibacteria group bacterium]